MSGTGGTKPKVNSPAPNKTEEEKSKTEGKPAIEGGGKNPTATPKGRG